MFFRNRKPHQYSFSDRLEELKKLGFTVETQGSRARVSKLGCAALIEDGGDRPMVIGKAGVQVGDEIGLLVDGGYQKFFQTPKDKKIPALAEHLMALHKFQEDLREGLGLTSLYNQGLGTTFDQHMYDRVKGRDSGKTNFS